VTTLNEAIKNPITIGFDAKRAFFNSSGLGNYSRNLLSSFAEYYPENTYYLFTPKTKNRFVLANEEKFRLIAPDLFLFKLVSPLWRSIYMTNDIARIKPEIFHGLSHELPVGIERTGVKSVITVHDLIFMRFPEYYKWIDSKIYTRKLINACRISDRIIAISNQTKEDLMSYLKVPPDKISVIYQSCNPVFRNNFTEEYNLEIRKKYNLPERYLLYVGTIEERKNLLGIVKGLHSSNIDIPLIVIGRKVRSYYENILSYIASNKLSNIIFAESILNTELPIIYRNAECFIYTSFFEGFGIPLLEALVSGTPVITSKGGCFSEAGGPGSIYVDPANHEEIGEAISKVTGNKGLRDKMINIGTEHSKKFNDDIIASDYMKFYHSIIE
jgi:glycosyltransferase involved in cell wall biosynthesis